MAWKCLIVGKNQIHPMEGVVVPKIVHVCWRDSAQHLGWVDPVEEELKVHPIESIGFLVEETDDHIIIASGHNMAEGAVPWCQVVVIPIGAVVEKKVLRG
jgi:hypothetical protein